VGSMDCICGRRRGSKEIDFVHGHSLEHRDVRPEQIESPLDTSTPLITLRLLFVLTTPLPHCTALSATSRIYIDLSTTCLLTHGFWFPLFFCALRDFRQHHCIRSCADLDLYCFGFRRYICFLLAWISGLSGFLEIFQLRVFSNHLITRTLTIESFFVTTSLHVCRNERSIWEPFQLNHDLVQRRNTSVPCNNNNNTNGCSSNSKQ